MNLLTRIKRKIKRDKWLIRAFFPSLIFNLRHLPFSQARHLPILVYKGKFMNNTGKYVIEGDVHFGMIELGRHRVSLYPSNGIVLENRGVIVFHGSAIIGSDSAITLGETGRLEFGKNFSSSAGLKIACYDSITFGENISVGWQTMIVDTDFHSLKKVNGGGVQRTVLCANLDRGLYVAWQWLQDLQRCICAGLLCCRGRHDIAQEG